MIAAPARTETRSRVLLTTIDAGLMEQEGPSMDAETKMTAAEFDALMPRLGRLTVDTVTIARSVLVDGQKPFEAAAQHGTSRQRVHTILKRVNDALREFPLDWKRVDVWLPPHLAEQAEAWAQQARADLPPAPQPLPKKPRKAKAGTKQAATDPAEADQAGADNGSSGASD